MMTTTKANIFHAQMMSWAEKRDGERLLKLVPPDTRGLTSRICGDPLPGRSALDKRKAHAA